MLAGMITLFFLMMWVVSVRFNSESLPNSHLSIIGCMGIPTHPTTAESWVAGSLVLVLSTVGDLSVGPVVYTIVSPILTIFCISYYFHQLTTLVGI
jgi:hypothetical protein